MKVKQLLFLVWKVECVCVVVFVFVFYRGIQLKDILVEFVLEVVYGEVSVLINGYIEFVVIYKFFLLVDFKFFFFICVKFLRYGEVVVFEGLEVY